MSCWLHPSFLYKRAKRLDAGFKESRCRVDIVFLQVSPRVNWASLARKRLLQSHSDKKKFRRVILGGISCFSGPSGTVRGPEDGFCTETSGVNVRC